MFSNLYPLAKTQEELETLRSEFEQLAASLYQPEGKFDEVLSNKVRPACAEAVKKLLVEGQISDKQKFFEEALKELSQPKILSLTLAYEPKQEAVERIWQWASKNIAGWTVLKLRVEPSMGAGVILEYAGKFRNYSLRKILDDYFATKLENLVKILAQ